VSDSQPVRQVKSLHLGEVQISSRPVGVNLIISGSDNPFRFLLAPLAASIAAGNVTILAAAASHDSRFISLLSRVWTRYLDQDCVFLVPDFQPSEVKVDEVDLITIYGMFFVPVTMCFKRLSLILGVQILCRSSISRF
jgi:acyl-CoA reductase-like NAD-dependent aldehyde dehydrogenase